jgi:hypothetical protein
MLHLCRRRDFRGGRIGGASVLVGDDGTITTPDISLGLAAAALVGAVMGAVSA